MSLNNNRGQALIEMCVSMLPIGVLFGSMVFLLYFIWSYTWVQSHLYEATLCAVMQESIAECENEFRSQTRSALAFGQIEQLKISKRPYKYQGECVYRFEPWFEFQIQKEISYPILRSL